MRYATMMLLMAVVFAACRGKDSLVEVSDKDLTIQVAVIADSSDAASVSYKARLIPDKRLLADKNTDEKQALMYKMDSCFYMQINGKKKYASIVQPVANGVGGSFEYLLSFETAGNKSKNSVLVYDDRYINKKKYRLILNKE